MPPRKRDVIAKLRVFLHYGLICVTCGMDGTESYRNWELLQLDHTNGGGEADREAKLRPANGNRASGGVPFYRRLISLGFPEGFETMCRPCNEAKS